MNKYRQSFDLLCDRCKEAGLPMPFMTPGLFKEDRWQLFIGEDKFGGEVELGGEVERVIERALYWVSGYTRGITEETSEEFFSQLKGKFETELIEVGDFRCNENDTGLRLSVVNISENDAQIRIGTTKDEPFRLHNKSARFLINIFERLINQWESDED